MIRNSPFFVIGSDRSGTTMLRLMLNEHPELNVPRETWFIIELMDSVPIESRLEEKEKEKVHEIIVNHPRWKDLELDSTELKEIFQGLNKPYLREIINKIYEALANRAGKTRWGDKTPEYIKEVHRLNILFPGAKFIHVIRDGRDVCISLMQKRWRGTMAQNIARYWVEYVGKGIKDGRNLQQGKYMEITYEDMVSNTKKALIKICEFLEVEYSPCMLKFYENAETHIAPWEKTHHIKTMRAPKEEDLYRWKREASFMQIIAFEAIAGQTMDMLGQERKFKGMARLFPEIFRIVEGIFWRLLCIRREIKKQLRKPKENKANAI
jgi:hypothetical protein